MEIRLKAFDVFGAARGVVPEWSELEYTDCLNDLPVLNIKVAVGSLAAQRLAAPVEVALEYRLPGGSWVEPANARFISTAYDFNLADDGEYLTVPCLGVGVVTRWASVWDATVGDEDGKRVFSASSPGKILHTLFQAAANRVDTTGLKWGKGQVSWDFTETVDTAGQGWGKNASPTFNPSDTLLKVLDWLASKGAVDWRFQARTLQVYKSGGAMARRKPGVVLRGAFSTALPVKVDLEKIATIARFRGDAGFMKTKTATDAYQGLGRVERWSEQGQVSRESTADLYLDRLLLEGHRPAEQWRREYTAAIGTHIPMLWANYQVGDWVSNGESELRIVEAGLRVDSAGELTGWETLGTRIDSILERLARRTTDLSSGAVGSDSGVLTPAGADTRTPKAPSGLVATSDITVTEKGDYRGVVTANWQAVTQATNNTEMTPARYQVGVRREGEDALRVVAETTGVTTGFYAEPGKTVAIRVRAVSQTGRVSAWSNQVNLKVKEDTVPPPRPATPTVTQGLEVIEISTTGLDYQGNPMPPDMSHYEVSVRDKNDTPQADSQVNALGELKWNRVVSPGTWWIALRAVDRAGNKSPWTEKVKIEVTALVDTEAIQSTIAKAEADLQAEAKRLDEYKNFTDGRLTPLEQTAQETATKATDAWNKAVSAQDSADAALARAMEAGNLMPANPVDWIKGVPNLVGQGIAVVNSDGSVSVDMTGQTDWKYGAFFTRDFIRVYPGRTYRVYADIETQNGDVSCGFHTYTGDDKSWITLWAKDHHQGGKKRAWWDITIPVGQNIVYARLTHYVHDGVIAKFENWEIYDITEALDALTKAENAEKIAEEARNAAATAQGVADSAMATASGKNKVTRSAATPSSNYQGTKGDIWWQLTGMNTASEQVIAQWIWDGATWRKSLVGDEVIAYITADKLRAAQGSFNTAFMKSLLADKGFVSELYANRIIVSGANLIRDPGFTRDQNWPIFTLNGDGTASMTSSTTGTVGCYEMPFQAINVIGGQTYKVRVEVRAHGYWVNSAKLRIYFRSYDREDKILRHDYITAPKNVGNAWTVIEGEITLPDNAITGSFGLHCIKNDRAVQISWRNPSCTPMADGNLIVDGAVTAAKVAALSIDTGHLKANAVTAAKIKAGAITSDLIVGGAIKGQHISANAIDGKIITGARIQTRFENNRGLKLADGKLVAYSPSTGSEVFSLSDSTTVWTAAGEPLQKIVIDPDLSGRLRMNFQGPGGHTASIFLVDANTTPGWDRGTLVIQGARNSKGESVFLRMGPSARYYLGTTKVGNYQSFISADPWKIDIYSDGKVYLGREVFMRNLPYVTSTYDVGAAAVGGEWQIVRTTSAARFKIDIQDVTADPTRILDIKPRDWYDKFESDRYAASLEDSAVDGVKPDKRAKHSAPPRRVPGLVAEEVEAAGLDQFVQYDPDGQISGVMYDRLWTLLIPLVKDLRNRVKTLEEQLRKDNQ